MDRCLKEFKGCPARAIGHADIQKFLTELGQTREAATRNRYLSTLSATFRLAVRNKRVDENPCKYVKRVKENNKVERYLSSEEEERLYKVLLMRIGVLRYSFH